MTQIPKPYEIVRFDTNNLARGEHVDEDEFDPIPDGALGSSAATPYVIAPDDWDTNGVPYGAWCRCDCGCIGRSTFGFDFYGKAGGPLKCERCAQRERNQ